jgi:phosphoenolpyruvate-protein phosphotransferase (PTS system enzyme I)
MSGGTVREGTAAAPGIVIGPVRIFRWTVPRVPQSAGIGEDEVEGEIARFREACEYAKERIRELKRRAEENIGPVEAQIFDPQLLMLEDVDLIGGTESYIRDNHLSAARAFEWRVLEWESQWSHTAHPMVLDKLNDLADVQARVLRFLLDIPDPDLDFLPEGEKVILVARDLSPSLAAQLDPEQVVGIATDAGTRTSHSAILARSMDIPAVVSLGDLSENLKDGTELILDGRAGKVVISPSEEEKRAYRQRDFQIREWEQELLLLAHLPARTRDGHAVALRANIDLPGEAETARAHGAEGVGLYRTEFLVVGRSAAPGEEEQYLAFRQVLEAFDGSPVIIRTFDLGGDKFPAFLRMPPEENPFLGWRAIRVCLDEPELFRAQLRALLRAAAHGDLRIMLPLVNETREIMETRALLEQEIEMCAGRVTRCACPAGGDDRDAGRRGVRGGAGEGGRLPLDRHQRPGAVHAGRGPWQLAAGAPVRPLPPCGAAPARYGDGDRAAGRAGGVGVRRAGRGPDGRLPPDRDGCRFSQRGPLQPRRDQEADPHGAPIGGGEGGGRGALGRRFHGGARGPPGALPGRPGPRPVRRLLELVRP